MKFKKLMLTGAALAVIAWAALAYADGTGASYRNGSYFNDKNGAKTTSAGYAQIDDANRDRDYKTWQTVISDSTSTFTADSLLTPFYTAPYRRFWLRVQVTWPRSTDAATNVKATFFAVQVRSHLSAQVDSLNTNPWYVFADSAHTAALYTGATGAYRMQADSVSQLATWQSKPLANEFYFLATRGQVRGVASTVAPLQTPEFYGEPANFWIPLADSRGVFYWGPYTTIRIRTISNNSNAAPQYVVDLVGCAN